ncbi:hypothetical protein [Croceicoccus mobilis]|uniref:Uncharacterized protein n=1 Tax=Croceicoccus mobilis TaxID=1703339 RepID=A0A916YU27_9SPHN|nr:hypothetical protein [Croceicoccus mobilis]GGD61152.1 hypothetical protein GCM10010990_08370 [Croceicoccus mobilis]
MSIVDKDMIRHLSIGFAIGAGGLFAVTGLPLIPQAFAAIF